MTSVTVLLATPGHSAGHTGGAKQTNKQMLLTVRALRCCNPSHSLSTHTLSSSNQHRAASLVHFMTIRAHLEGKHPYMTPSADVPLLLPLRSVPLLPRKADVSSSGYSLMSVVGPCSIPGAGDGIHCVRNKSIVHSPSSGSHGWDKNGPNVKPLW